MTPEQKYVEKQLGNGVICKRCGATLETFADKCTANLSEVCPGFSAIDNAKEEFKRREK